MVAKKYLTWAKGLDNQNEINIFSILVAMGKILPFAACKIRGKRDSEYVNFNHDFTMY